MNQNSLLLVSLKITSRFSTLLALFAFSVFSASLNPMPINIHAQTCAGINTTFSQENFSLQEKQIVQKELADLMRKAISIGAEIPEISGFEENNATLYVKVNVNNTGDRIANASDFYFTVNYKTGPDSIGVSTVSGSDAGVIVRLPESTYNVVFQRSETGDLAKDSFINSFSWKHLSGDCSGEIRSGESKECTIIMYIIK
jgi:hypothetical protein